MKRTSTVEGEAAANASVASHAASMTTAYSQIFVIVAFATLCRHHLVRASCRLLGLRAHHRLFLQVLFRKSRPPIHLHYGLHLLPRRHLRPPQLHLRLHLKSLHLGRLRLIAETAELTGMNRMWIAVAIADLAKMTRHATSTVTVSARIVWRKLVLRHRRHRLQYFHLQYQARDRVHHHRKVPRVNRLKQDATMV
mgnify:CR=1 FL=1